METLEAFLEGLPPCERLYWDIHRQSLAFAASIDDQPEEIATMSLCDVSLGPDTDLGLNPGVVLGAPLESFGADEIEIHGLKWMNYPWLTRASEHTMLALHFYAKRQDEPFVASQQEEALARKHGRPAASYFLVVAPECRPYIVGENAFNWEIEDANKYELTDSDAQTFRQTYAPSRLVAWYAFRMPWGVITTPEGYRRVHG